MIARFANEAGTRVTVIEGTLSRTVPVDPASTVWLQLKADLEEAGVGIAPYEPPPSIQEEP